MLWGNSLWVLSSENKKCIDSLSFTKNAELCLGGKPPPSLMRWLCSPGRRGALCQMAQCHFMLLSPLYLRHEAALAAVSWWRQGAAAVRRRYFNGLTDLWMVCHRGEMTWANPRTIVASIWLKAVTQVLIPLHLNLCSTPSVYRSRRPLGSPLAKMWRVYQCLFLHTAACRHINTDAHANTNTHCLCVPLSSQIRKHDIIFSVCLCTCAHTHTHTRICVCALMCPHIECAVKMLMSYLSWWPFLLCWCPVFL